MKPTISIRPQRISDAMRFFEILSNPNFKYFNVSVKSLKDEIKFLSMNTIKRKRKSEFNFTILYDEKIVGGIGLRIDPFRKYIGETGYFLDENYWGLDIAPKALKMLESFAFNKIKLRRLEIHMVPQNKASSRVAEKCGYVKEGLLKKKLLVHNKYHDAYLYAKVKG